MEYPFKLNPWTSDQRVAAEAIWLQFDRSRFRPGHRDASDLAQAPKGQSAKFEIAGDSANSFRDRVLSPSISRRVFADRSELNDYVLAYTQPLARSLAKLGGITTSFQLPMIDELARGVFFTRRIIFAEKEVSNGFVFIPESDLGIELGKISTDETMVVLRKQLWKESIRAKDHFAAGVQIVRDLPRRYQVAVKEMVLLHLEYLRKAEKSDWTVDGTSLEISPYMRSQIFIQSRFGRATFKY